MNKIEIYKTEKNGIDIIVQFENESVRHKIDQRVQLFDIKIATLNEHILNIFKKNNLEKNLTIRQIGNSDFSTKPTYTYNLDGIISVGYLVKSMQYTQFIQWETQRLKEYWVSIKLDG